MANKTKETLERNKKLGRRFNILFGDTPDLEPLENYTIRGNPNKTRWLNSEISNFSRGEICQIDSAIMACLRAGIDNTSALRITDPRVLVTKKDIGPNRAALLQEAFNHKSIK